MRRLCLALCLTFSSLSYAEAYLAIIIDDLGNNLARGEEAIALEGKVNVAIIPHTPHARALAELAVQQQKDVLVHMPMSSESKSYSTQGMLTPEMSREVFAAAVERNLAEIPQAAGVNNHMGSELTQSYPHMRWLMQLFKSHGLYFIDSRTSAATEALQAARDSLVPSDRRHVFLDNESDEHSINQQLDTAINTALENGFAIAIGHPRPSTLRVLKKRLAALSDEGVTLVSMSHYLALKQAR